MKSKIQETIKKLIDHGGLSHNTDWQSIKGVVQDANPVLEIENLYLKLGASKDIAKDTGAHLPWAEDHFKERINGEPLNPGKEYKNWPYYDKMDNDNLFRSSGQFSHTYMERMWSKDLKGRRFRYGDLKDVIKKLKINLYTRQAFLSIWHPEDQSIIKERVPCTLGYWFKYSKEKLNMTYFIRSCDARRHFRNDIYLSYRLLEYVSKHLKIKPGGLDMWIGSFHCFKSDLYILKKNK